MWIVNLLLNGGTVLWVLVGLSVAVLALVIYKLIEFRLMRVSEQFSVKDILDSVSERGISAVTKELYAHPSPIAHVGARTLDLCAFEGARRCTTEQERELELWGVEEVRRMESGQGAIALVAHLSPLLGLLGTVVGMIMAFQGLEQADGSANPAMLAGGIWEALLTTAVGLMIAIPLSAVHHYFESRIDKVTHRMELLSVGLLRHFRQGDAPLQESQNLVKLNATRVSMLS